MDQVNMSLDDIIKQNKTKFSKDRKQNGRKGDCTETKYRRINNGGIKKTYLKPNIKLTKSKEVLESTTLNLSNLDFGITTEQIKSLFLTCGHIRKAVVHYNESGRSLGSAQVIFEKRIHAINAIKQYHGVPLDGRKMIIEMSRFNVPSRTHNGRLSNRHEGNRRFESFKAKNRGQNSKNRDHNNRRR